MTRPQHHLLNIPRGYYYFQLSTCTLRGILKFLVFHVDSYQTSQSKMVLGFQSTLLSFFFLGGGGFAYACIGNTRLCVEQIRLVDCSRAGLESTPQTKKRMAYYTSFMKIK